MRWWKGTWTRKFKFGFIENTKIGGFGGSVVCDRVAKLVLGDVGLEFRRRLWEKENEGKEKVERGTGQ